MVAYAKRQYITPDEYLRREQEAETKSEYEDGVIVAMAGATPEHATITYNLGGMLWQQLRGGPCHGFSPDLRVRIVAGNKYYYPDVAVVCGEPVYENRKGFRHLINPSVIVEVLSDSTERRDRGIKRHGYEQIVSLGVYVLVYQDRALIDTYTRNIETGLWDHMQASGLDSILNIPLILFEAALSDVYEHVSFASIGEQESAT